MPLEMPLPEKIRALSMSVDHPVWVWSNHDFPDNQKNAGVIIKIVQS